MARVETSSSSPFSDDSKNDEMSLRDQLLGLWHSLPGRGAFMALMGAWFLAFHFLGNSTFGYIDTHSLYSWLAYAYRDSEQGDLGYLVPIVVLVLLIWRRKELILMEKRPSWSAGLVFLMGISVHILGYMVQQPRVSAVGFFVGLYGITGMVWGWRMMLFAAFPFSLFAFCVPLGQAADFLTVPLRMNVARLSVSFCDNVLGIDVMREGSMIFNGTRTYQYDVAPACSGIRSLTALGFIILLYAFLSFSIWWKRALLVASVIPLAVLGNTARIVAVIVAGETAGQEAGAAIEQKLGFLTFLVALGGALGLAQVLERFSGKKAERAGANQIAGLPGKASAEK